MSGIADDPTLLSRATRLQPDPPQLTEAYHKARKHYALFAGLLMAWEFVGVAPASQPLANVNVTLRNPQATPLVLVALVAYFGFRLEVEWRQNNALRRRTPASRIDFAVAHVLGAGAIVLFLLQRAWQINVGAVLLSDWGVLLGAATMSGFSIVAAHFALRDDNNSVLLRHSLNVVGVLSLGLCLLCIVSPTWFGLFAETGPTRWQSVLAILVGGCLGSPMSWVFRPAKAKSESTDGVVGPPVRA